MPGRRPPLRERPAAARARPRGAAEAVSRGRDLLAREAVERLDVEDAARAPAERDLQHLVEVAVVERAVPADGDEVPAHEAGHGRGVEVVHEQAPVLVRAPLALE